MTADILKIYRRIWVALKNRDYQRIFWRPNTEQEVQIFSLNTVTYGTVPTSFLATGCLHWLADEKAIQYPTACATIKQDFYMDDYLGGADSLHDALQLRDEIIEVSKGGGFELRKWTATESSLLAGLNNEHDDPTLILYLSENSAKILGLHWDPSCDIFKCNVNLSKCNVIVTEHQVLSDYIATIFDPLDLVGPVVIKAKTKMQQLWSMGIGWDDTLPEETKMDWQEFRKGLTVLNGLFIPKCITVVGEIIDIQVHGFSDASMQAFGSCIYLVTTNNKGDRMSRLICAKSRVSPLKSISLPHLELCGAILLARLAAKIIPKLNLNLRRQTFWTDSFIVLAWISSPSKQWKTFIAHRVLQY